MSSFRCLVVSLLVLLLGSLPSNANASTSTSGQPKPPANFTVAVEGIVFCKSCKLQGYDKSMDASPLPGAIASLLCLDRKRGTTLNYKTTSNSKGYFLIQTPKLESFSAGKCRVFVKWSPLPYCDVLVYPGRAGASLKFERVLKLTDGPQSLYTAGAFVFAPRNVSMCPNK